MKELRTKLKLSHTIMAQLLDLKLSNLMNIEKGKRPLPQSQKANYKTLLDIASMPEWEKLEADNSNEEALRKSFVLELKKELKQHQNALKAAQKRHVQLQSTYEQHTQILKSLSALDALMNDKVDALFKTQVAFSKEKIKYNMRYKLLPGLFSIHLKIEMANKRIEMIKNILNNPSVLILKGEIDK